MTNSSKYSSNSRGNRGRRWNTEQAGLFGEKFIPTENEVSGYSKAVAQSRWPVQVPEATLHPGSLTNMQPDLDSVSTIHTVGEAQTPAFPVIVMDIV